MTSRTFTPGQHVRVVTKEKREELARLHARAATGPVRIERRDDDDGSVDHIVYGVADVAACFETANANARVNAELVCSALNALPDLLETAEFAERAADVLREHGDMLCVAIPPTLADERFLNAGRALRELLSSLPARKEATGEAAKPLMKEPLIGELVSGIGAGAPEGDETARVTGRLVYHQSDRESVLDGGRFRREMFVRRSTLRTEKAK